MKAVKTSELPLFARQVEIVNNVQLNGPNPPKWLHVVQFGVF